MSAVTSINTLSGTNANVVSPSAPSATDAQILGRSVTLNQLLGDQATLSDRASNYAALAESLSTFQAAARALTNGTQVAGITASSNSAAVTATVGNNAVAGTYNVSVSRLAQAQINTSASSPTATSAAAFGTGTLGIKVGSGPTTNVSISNTMSLTDIVNAINNANAGVSARIAGSTGSYNIVVTGNLTGAANAVTFTQSGVTANFASNQNQAALDSNYTINGQSYTSTYNTGAFGIPGTTLALNALTSSAIVTLGANATAVQNSVASFVSSYNAAIGSLNATLADPALSEDIVVRTIARQLSRATGNVVAGASGPFQSLSSIGISRNADGTLSLNPNAVSAATSQNAQSVSALLVGNGKVAGGTGLAATLYNITKTFAEPGVGSLGQIGYKQSSQALRLSRSIANQQRYVDLATDGLSEQNTQLQIALSQSQAQSLLVQTLTSQIGIQTSSYTVSSA